MKRSKVHKLVRDVLDERRVFDAPVTYDMLVVRFADRSITFRGATFTSSSDAVSIPMLATDRLIVPRDGHVL